ncbi:MAG TPA: hypothetical protein VG738_01555 [Chitinophagaceae bacterium]|nr:hypothetical protein [Chitinophagaceae bacterium]
MLINFYKRALLCILLVSPACIMVQAQTDIDGDMMAKKTLCLNAMYSYGSWTNYWEGTLKRDNQNLGRVSTQMAGVMMAYGLYKNVTILAGLPYVQTHATAGTLHGQKGLQDVNLWIKWKAYQASIGRGTFSVFAAGGLTFPSTNYIADFLPLSIGLHSTNLSGRLIADYGIGKFFVTVSGTYTYRNNITIDRTAYYTTELHNTNEVQMPDMAMEQLRAGYRSKWLRIEAVADNMNTLGGFDIRRNDMPFPSNKMNSTDAGLFVKYTFKKLPALSLSADGSYVITGRNVGQTTMFGAGVSYVLDFNHKKNSK